MVWSELPSLPPKNKVEERNIEELYANPSNIAPLQERQDLLNILLGVDQEYNSIPIQDEYKPSKSKDADTVYYKSPATESYIINQLQKDPQEFIRQVRGYKDGVNYWAVSCIIKVGNSFNHSFTSLICFWSFNKYFHSLIYKF